MLIVKKFGGSSVADKERIFNVAKRCIEDYEAGNDVVVVLSQWERQQTVSLRWHATSIRKLPRERWICSWQPESRHLLH